MVAAAGNGAFAMPFDNGEFSVSLIVIDVGQNGNDDYGCALRDRK